MPTFRRRLQVTKSELLATKNNPSSCWLQINSNAYDVTSYAGRHPVGFGAIHTQCRKEISQRYFGAASFHTTAGLGSAINMGIVVPDPTLLLRHQRLSQLQIPRHHLSQLIWKCLHHILRRRHQILSSPHCPLCHQRRKPPVSSPTPAPATPVQTMKATFAQEGFLPHPFQRQRDSLNLFPIVPQPLLPLRLTLQASNLPTKFHLQCLPTILPALRLIWT